MFLIILLAAIVPVSAAGTLRWRAQLAVILNGLLGRTLSSLDDLQPGMPIFDDNRGAQV